MSLAELQQKVTELSREERLRLVAYIRHLEQANDPAWLGEMELRNDRMSAGEKFIAADFDKVEIPPASEPIG